MTSDETIQLPPIGNMLRLTFEKWYSDNIPRHAAVLAFYALFAVAPILLLCVEVLGLIYGRDSAEQRVLAQVSSFVNNAETGAWISTFLHNILPSSANWWVTAGFVFALLFGASSFFNELKIVLNQIWGIPVPDEPNIGRFVWRRLQAVLMVLISSLLIFFGLILASWLSTVAEWAALYLKIGSGAPTWSYVVLVFVFLTLVFALVYKFVPDADVAWRNVWIGAAATALLLSVTRLLISFYFSYSYTTTMFGAASALVIILLSVYYSTQIFFLGAEFTYVYSQLGDEHALQTSDADTDGFAFSRVLPPRQTGPVKLDVINIESQNIALEKIAIKDPEPATVPLEQQEQTKISRLATLIRPIRNRLPRLKFGKKGAPDPPKVANQSPGSNPVDVPLTNAPITDAPITDIPITDMPITDMPITDIPITDMPITDMPITDIPTTDIPITNTPDTGRFLSRETVEGPNTDTPNTSRTSLVHSIGSNVKQIILLLVRILRPIRQLVVAVGVIFAVSLAALTGIPFWRKRKSNGTIAPPAETSPPLAEDE